MMAALGAVAQHYIKFPGFVSCWKRRGLKLLEAPRLRQDNCICVS